MKIEARDYQRECLAKVQEAVKSGEKRALVVMASGLGKTITSAFAVQKFFTARPFGRTLILCHSEKILRQSKAKYQEFFGAEYSYGMYVSNEKTLRQTDFLFATFQTMKEKRKDFPKDAFSYIVVDEAHHSKALTYFPTIRYFQPEFLLGLTATPDRLDGQKIEEIYGEPVYELGFVEAECRGLLTECDYELVLDDLSQEDIDKYLESNEKLSIAQLNNTIFAPKRDEEIVRLIKKYSSEEGDPKTMIFCKTVEHARRITKLMGDGAATVHKGQTDLANDLALNAFREGRIRTIISVQMLNEGIDVPDANVIVFLRNTVSPSVFFQQLGRGVRLSAGKKKVKVLDFVGNCERIQMVLQLKQDIDDFRIKVPLEKTCTHDKGAADTREKFTLNIATPEFKARTVDIIELLERKTKGLWTQERVIQIMQKMHQNGERVTLESCANNPDLPSPDTIRYLFEGSFNKALRAANIPINYEVCSISRAEMIAEGKAMLERGERITSDSIDNNPRLPNRTKVRKTFGSIRKFVELCEGRVVVEGDFSRMEMVQRYWAESKKAGYWLKLIEVDDNENLASKRQYQKEFGCREDLIMVAEKELGPIISEVTKERQLQQAKELHAKRYYEASVKNGYWLRGVDLGSKNGLIGAKAYLKYFPNGHQELIDFTYELCGDLPNYRENAPKRDRPTQLFLKQYHEASEEAGHWLTLREIAHSRRLASAATYQRRYKSLHNLRRIAIEAYGDFTKENTTN